ncbi:uroporphyrinogen decarboxylase [Sneathiella sp. DP05]|uniref:Uroporphyrinogen decarboxylase n=1 Tax=Sneathiella litorea TaxID=2606216 RepID=A0A6L8W3W4_9PROT|nr:uroporphyrinogen decarboxylase [Sneathiella litorea]MZR29785.1 uroporphyrinogen decarboxylase [Sneathiella litorea]
MLNSLSGEVTDRPPFWLMRQAGRYLPEYREIRAKAGNFLDLCYNPELAEEVTLQPLRRYGMDAAILFADILLIPHALGQPLAYREGEGPVLDPIRSAKELGKLDVADIHKTLDPVYETVGRLSQSIPKDCTLIGFAGAPWTVATYMVEGRGSKDYANIKNWAYSDPAGFGTLMDILVEATIEYLLKQVEAGAEVVQLFDTWAGVLPDDEFRKWAIEPTKRIVEGLHTQHPDLPVIGFPKGVGGNIIDFVRETGVTAVSLDTGTPLDWAAREVQSLVPVQGNLDPMLLVTGGAAMEERIVQIRETLGKKPFIFNLGHGIVPQTPPENVARLAEIIRGS